MILNITNSLIQFFLFFFVLMDSILMFVWFYLLTKWLSLCWETVFCLRIQNCYYCCCCRLLTLWSKVTTSYPFTKVLRYQRSFIHNNQVQFNLTVDSVSLNVYVLTVTSVNTEWVTQDNMRAISSQVSVELKWLISVSFSHSLSRGYISAAPPPTALATLSSLYWTTVDCGVARMQKIYSFFQLCRSWKICDRKHC